MRLLSGWGHDIIPLLRSQASPFAKVFDPEASDRRAMADKSRGKESNLSTADENITLRLQFVILHATIMVLWIIKI